MGQKVSPHGLRVGIIKDWGSKWYADKNNFADYLIEDNKVREFVKKKLYAAGVSKVVIGRSGDGIEQLKADLVKLTGKTVDIDIREVRRAELDAQLTAESIAQALERRIAFRRAMKQAIGRTMKANAKGIKVLVSGRLGGAEIARSESYSEGNVPLHTLRADIDYGFAEADTTYGKIGVKVWINHGEILDKGLQSIVREEKNEGRKNDRRKGGRRRDGERRPRRNPRENRAELPKAVNPRVRNTPKEEPKAQEPEVEAPQVENEAVETATEE